MEANFAPRVRGRIELFQTRYRRAADSFGEVWVVIDGKRRYSWGDITFIQAEAAAYQPDRASIKGENPSREEYCAANRRVLGNLRACSNSAAPRRGWRRLNYRS